MSHVFFISTRELYLTRKLVREQRANYKKHAFISVDIPVSKQTP
jgi:hypothetical protein